MKRIIERKLAGLVLTFAVLVLAAAGCTAVPIPPIVIDVGDGTLVFSPYNWRIQGSNYAQSNNPGAYLRLGFSGTSIAASFDTSAFDALGRSDTERPQIWVSIDDKAPKYFLPEGSDPLVLASGLAAGNHTLELGFSAVLFTNDRWDTPANIIKITGFRIDAGASTFLPSSRPKRMVLFWDSIGEGFRVLEDSVGVPGSRENSDAFRAFGLRAAEDLDAEVGIVAFAAQGWTRPGATGSNVPAFPGSWDSIDGNIARAFTPAPDLVVVGHGTNDGLLSVPDSTIRGAVRTWLEQARSALPGIDIAVVIPFGGYARDAITQAFDEYQVDFPGDSLVHLIDLGGDAQDIVAANTTDNIHPDIVGQRQLADLLSAALAPILGP